MQENHYRITDISPLSTQTDFSKAIFSLHDVETCFSEYFSQSHKNLDNKLNYRCSVESINNRLSYDSNQTMTLYDTPYRCKPWELNKTEEKKFFCWEELMNELDGIIKKADKNIEKFENFLKKDVRSTYIFLNKNV